MACMCGVPGTGGGCGAFKFRIAGGGPDRGVARWCGCNTASAKSNDDKRVLKRNEGII